MITNEKTAFAPAFQARLDIQGVKLGGAKKIKKVQQLFAQKTQHYSNDVFELTGMRRQIDDNGEFYHTVDIYTNGKYDTSYFTGEMKKYFAENSVDDIVKSFVRLFKKSKADEVFRNRLSKIDRNILHANKTQKANTINAALAEQRGNKLYAERYSTIAKNNEERINVLEVEREKVNDTYKSVIDKITDDPIFELNI